MYRFGIVSLLALLLMSSHVFAQSSPLSGYSSRSDAISAIGVLFVIVGIALYLLPLFAVDWTNHATVGWCILLIMVFGTGTAFSGPPLLREVTLVLLWGLSTIAAAITRLGITLSRMLAIQASATRHDPRTGLPLDAPRPAQAVSPHPAVTSSAEALQYRRP